MTNKKVFTVSVGVIKAANAAMINSNKLKHTFVNIGNKFVVDKSDMKVIREILDKKFIRIYKVS